MKILKKTALLAFLLIAVVAGLYRVGAAQGFSDLRIISPANGAKINTDFVRISYELINPAVAAGATPHFRLQLDTDPFIRTQSTEHTFTGLAPGRHTVLIELVDANGTPIDSAVNAVQFTVVYNPGARPSSELREITSPELKRVAQGDTSARQNPDQLSNTGSALPLVSVIGFGVLLGGIVSALRTR